MLASLQGSKPSPFGPALSSSYVPLCPPSFSLCLPLGPHVFLPSALEVSRSVLPGFLGIVLRETAARSSMREAGFDNLVFGGSAYALIRPSHGYGRQASPQLSLCGIHSFVPPTLLSVQLSRQYCSREYRKEQNRAESLPLRGIYSSQGKANKQNIFSNYVIYITYENQLTAMEINKAEKEDRDMGD